jgi:hypothetical protein
MQFGLVKAALPSKLDWQVIDGQVAFLPKKSAHIAGQVVTA